MKFSRWVRRLEKKKIISRWPHPVVPFVLCGIILIEGYFFPIERLRVVLYYLAGFTFVFGILHWIIVSVLQRKA